MTEQLHQYSSSWEMIPCKVPIYHTHQESEPRRQFGYELKIPFRVFVANMIVGNKCPYFPHTLVSQAQILMSKAPPGPREWDLCIAKLFMNAACFLRKMWENGCVAPIEWGGHKKILRDSAKNPTKSIKIRKHQIDTRKFRRPRSG